MKIRNIGIALSLLLVFCFCLSLTAQVTVDTSTKSPEAKAKDAYDVALYHYTKVKKVSDAAETKYLLSNDAFWHLNSLYSIASSKDKKAFDYAKGSISKTLDAAGADPVDMITDAAGFIFEKIEEGMWNNLTPSENKSAIESAIGDQRQKRKDRWNDWDAALKITNAAEATMDAAMDAWQEQKPLVYTFGPKDGSYTAYVGERHTAFLTLNKRYSEITWYLNGTQKFWGTGSDAKSHQNSFYLHSSGSHTIAVKAKMASTSEVVDESYTVNVLTAGISLNKYQFTSDETLVVTVERPGLLRTSMVIQGGAYMPTGNSRGVMASASNDGTGKCVMSYNLSGLGLIGSPDVYLGQTVTINIVFRKDGETEVSSSDHYEQISVKTPYDSNKATVPDTPESFSVSSTNNKGQIWLYWTKPNSDNGSGTEYLYQLSYYTKNGWTPWPASWSSVSGTWDEKHLESGLHSNTNYRVRMCAKNSAGTSGITSTQTVTTR